MSRKSPSQLKILNDTLDLMTLMTHAYVVTIPIIFFAKKTLLFKNNPYLCGVKKRKT